MAIVGAGYIGLEVAAVAAILGMDVTVIEMQNRVMKRVVSPQISQIYEKVHRAHGVELRLNAGIERFLGEKHVVGVKLADSQEIAADVVVVGIGIQPNIALAADAGLEVGDGIVVDDRCLTSDQNIFAVGDCTFHPNALLGRSIRLESVHNALEQARTAAANVCGEDLRYADIPWFWSDQYDLKLQIAGLSEGYDKAVMRGDAKEHGFSCVYLRDGQIIAVDAVNSPKDFIQSKKLIAQHARLDIGRLPDPVIELKDLAV
jgi:3-phenylpropionate/trans-cinnamate dioxygenase ferredoxin reductase subunit